ncbi:MAG: hypothetical protein KME12_10085 [Trichocoleus desertorum ATA4-8-CV12]|jgi:hypothetical protein|nr:hypothetical protein [Trichocoleus desertorum ATA4-8-CV12]
MLVLIIVILVFAGFTLSEALVLLPLQTLSLLHIPTWLGFMLLIALAAWFLGD